MTASAEEVAEPWFLPQPKRLIPAAAFALVGLAIGLLMAHLLQPISTATAVVVGPAGNGRTELRLPGAAETSIVDWPEMEGAPPGSTLTVGLGGECECVPLQVTDVMPVTIFLAVAVPLLFLFWAFRTVREDQYGRHQRRAAAADPNVARPVSVRPHFALLRRKVTGLWLEVFDRDTGAPLGWLLAGLVTPHFAPSRLAWMIGADDPGGRVALEDDTRVHMVLPVSPLRATAPPATDWSADAVRLLGWEGRGGAGVAPPGPRLPVSGRVSIASGNAAPTLWPEARRARERMERLLAPRRVVLALILSASLSLALYPWLGLLAYGPFMVVPVAVVWARSALTRPLREAMEAQAPELAPHARVLAELLISHARVVEATSGLPPPPPPPARVDRSGQTPF